MSTVSDFLDDGDDGAGAATGTAVTDSTLDALINDMNGGDGSDAPTPEELAAEQATESGYGSAEGADPMNTDKTIKQRKEQLPAGDDVFDDDEPTSTTTTQQAPAKAGAPAAAPAAQEVEIVPGYTATKLSEALKSISQIEGLRQQADSLNGKVGSIQDTIKRVTSAAPGKKIEATTLKRVTQEFGPEYAQALADDLNEALGQGGTAGASEDQVTTLVQNLMQSQLMPEIQKIHKTAVRRVHPDAEQFFKGGAKHDQLLAYVKTLPEAEATEFVNTWDSEIIAGHLDKLKAGLKAAEQANQKTQTEQERQRRLRARGTVPTGGTGGSGGDDLALSEEDQMEAGWKEAGGSSRTGKR